jgi:hypothetical protein
LRGKRNGWLMKSSSLKRKNRKKRRLRIRKKLSSTSRLSSKSPWDRNRKGWSRLKSRGRENYRRSCRINPKSTKGRPMRSKNWLISRWWWWKRRTSSTTSRSGSTRQCSNTPTDLKSKQTRTG